MKNNNYETFIRSRITELRLRNNISEHRMSLDLDKSGSYIRSITSGLSMPSVKELMKIIHYFNMSPSEFFLPLEAEDSIYLRLCKRLREMDEDSMKKVNIFLDMIE